MVNVQEWLDKNYPKETRSKVTELNINSQNLPGDTGNNYYNQNILKEELLIENFPNLSRFVSSTSRINKLTINGCQNLEEIKFTSQQSSSNILKLSCLDKLNKVVCSNGGLTNLEINNCPELTYLDCSNNNISKFDFTTLNNRNLNYLDISNNSQISQDLSSLAPFINLETLKISNNRNNRDTMGMNYYSHNWYGSLEVLKDCNKLKNLDIKHTGIKNGLEYLPNSLENIACEEVYINHNHNYGNQEINYLPLILGAYDGNFQDWKKAQTYLIKKVKEEENTELYSRINNLEKFITNWENNFQQILTVKEQLATLNKKLENDLVQKESTILNLQTELFPLKLEKAWHDYKNLLNNAYSVLEKKDQEKLAKLMEVIEKVLHERKENDFFAQELIKERKEYFQNKLEDEMIDKLCQLKEDIIKLQTQIQITERLQNQIQIPPK